LLFSQLFSHYIWRYRTYVLMNTKSINVRDKLHSRSESVGSNPSVQISWALNGPNSPRARQMRGMRTVTAKIAGRVEIGIAVRTVVPSMYNLWTT
jgi:hypothetical protein